MRTRTKMERPRCLSTAGALTLVILTACGTTGSPTSSEGTSSPSAAPTSSAPAVPLTAATASVTTAPTATAPPAPSLPTTTPVPTAPVGWQRVTVEGPAPGPRSSAALAAAPDGALWLHGGLVQGASVGELWRFDGTRWAQMQVNGSAPPPRHEHVAVWDGPRSRLVIALGEASNGEVFDDVWAFDPAAGTWSQLAKGGGPAARYGSCAVLDREGRMMITHGFSSSVRFDDTWIFDLATAAWSDISPAGGPRPAARCLHSCAFDPDSGDLTLFGGRKEDELYLGDTWRLGSAGWSAMPGEGPSARVRSRAGRVGGSIHVVGGTGSQGLAGNTWVLSDGAWRIGASDAPADRDSAAVAQGNGVVWLFGGKGASGGLADLWRLG